MKQTVERLNRLATKIGRGENVKVGILGLGSVGNYLLEYLNNWDFANVEIYVGCRNVAKVQSDMNIVRVARLIRGKSPKPMHIVELDLDDVSSIVRFLDEVSPDFVVNSSRAYSGLKYGSISWHTIRAYGLWAPLAMKYIRNIMKAHSQSSSNAIVINTSYSDAVIPWLKSAGMAYPDFGSGNLNHLVPRIKMAAAEIYGIPNAADIEVTLATSHFHDVVISKEGQTEGVEPLLHLAYRGEELKCKDHGEIWRRCAIAMPVDAKRNMMNASSNFEIISKIVETICNGGQSVLHSPGVGGNIGGYPVAIDAAGGDVEMSYYERYFSFVDMNALNRRSIALDGVEDVRDGVLHWTPYLVEKVKRCFGVDIPHEVQYDAIPETADFIIESIIKPYLSSRMK